MRISDWSSDVCSSDLPDMRMRSDIGVAKLIGRQMQRPGMIEEDERPDHAALPKGQNALDSKAAAKIGLARVDPQIRHYDVSLLPPKPIIRPEEHTHELQTLIRISYAVCCLKNQTLNSNTPIGNNTHINKVP